MLIPLLSLMMMTSISAGPTHYRVVPEQSDVFVELKPAKTILSGLSHRHVIVAENFSGQVKFDPDDPEACRVDIQVPVKDLVVDPEPKRKALGFEKKLSDGDKDEIRKNMLKKNQLWADKYETVRFESVSCVEVEPERFRIRGALTVRGVQADLELPIQVQFDPEGLRARTVFVQVHEDFGFKPYSAALGALKNDERIRFHVDIRAIKDPSTERGP
ncbi:MAG: YceI family protein [Myxococcota bacterium]